MSGMVFDAGSMLSFTPDGRWVARCVSDDVPGVVRGSIVMVVGWVVYVVSRNQSVVKTELRPCLAVAGEMTAIAPNAGEWELLKAEEVDVSLQ